MRNVFWGFVLVMFGGLLLLDNLGYADFGEMLSQFWPLLLIVWGVSILIRRSNRISEPQPQPQPANVGGAPSSASPADYSFVMDGDVIHQSEVFGDTHITVTSSNFMGGSVSTVFGDCVIDLSKATFAQGEHTLRVHTVFGDSRITLPPGAAVAISANSTFGEMHMKDQQKGGFTSFMASRTPGYDSAPNRMQFSISKVFGDLIVN
jgi:predicted membrane protein